MPAPVAAQKQRRDAAPALRLAARRELPKLPDEQGQLRRMPARRLQLSLLP